MKNRWERDIALARMVALINQEDILHALDCHDCGLREEMLFALAIMGWTEAEFCYDAIDWSLSHE